MAKYAFIGIYSVLIGIFFPLHAQDAEQVGRSRVVTVGTVSTMNISASSTTEMIQKVLNVMDQMVPFGPDIICLPESFAFTNIQVGSPGVSSVAGKSLEVLSPFMNFAATNNVYIICPTYTLDKGDVYISAILIDRKGVIQGKYDKTRPARGEMEMGIRPGKMDPPVFETDFGKIGIQICYDIKYADGWKKLKDKGAEIIFWPSAYAAGREISSMAWRNQVYIVSSTLKDTSKICDITGETIAQTNGWQRNWACASINLEKAFIGTWPAVERFPEIRKKYGSKITITTYGEEEWTVIESLDPKIRVKDILDEFNLEPLNVGLRELETAQERLR